MLIIHVFCGRSCKHAFRLAACATLLILGGCKSIEVSSETIFLKPLVFSRFGELFKCEGVIEQKTVSSRFSPGMESRLCCNVSSINGNSLKEIRPVELTTLGCDRNVQLKLDLYARQKKMVKLTGYESFHADGRPVQGKEPDYQYVPWGYTQYLVVTECELFER